MLNLLWGVVVVLVILWMVGFTLHVAGAFIHLLLVVAAVAVLFRIITGRRLAS